MTREPISDRWERGEVYEQYVGRWSRRVAPLFLAWLQPAAGLRWLDVGCGTGALSDAVLSRAAPERVAGIEPSRGFLRTAEQNLAGRALLAQAAAAGLPFGPAAFDALVSGLVLNFVPDPRAALAEMARVTRPGGLIAAYVWDYGGKMEFMRLFWDAVIELDPSAAHLDEGPRFPLCHPQALGALFAGAGLGGVETTALDAQISFAGFDDYWQPFLGRQGPGPAYVATLDERAQTRLRDRLRERLPVQPDGTITLLARAWAVRGLVQP